MGVNLDLVKMGGNPKPSLIALKTHPVSLILFLLGQIHNVSELYVKEKLEYNCTAAVRSLLFVHL